MSTQRSHIIAGPALVTHAGQTYYSEGDITVRLNLRTSAIATSAFGRLGNTVEEVEATIEFTPSGDWLAMELPMSFAINFTTPGLALFGASDLPLVIQPLASTQKKWTFHNAQVTALPAMRFAAGKTAFSGQLRFTALRVNGSAWATANSLYTIAANTTVTHAFNKSNHVTTPWAATWAPLNSGGGSPTLYQLDTEAGWTITPTLTTEPQMTDECGTVNYLLNDVGFRIEGIPIVRGGNGALEEVASKTAIQGGTVQRGALLSELTGLHGAMIFTGPNDYKLTIKDAAVTALNGAFGPTKKQLQTVTWEAQRVFVSNAPVAMAEYQVEAP